MIHRRLKYSLFVLPLVAVTTFFSFSGKTDKLDLIKSSITELAESPELKNGFVGFMLKGVEGNNLIEYNAEKALIPASNLKVVTTAAALEMLGPDFKFVTEIGYSGSISNGILTGDIVIRGGGDPTLGSDRFTASPSGEKIITAWVDFIKKAGIKEVTGNVLADVSAFEANTTPDGWVWTDVGNYYGSGAGGINWNENTYRIVFKPAEKVGDLAQIVRTEPAVSNLVFINRMKTGKPGSGDNGYIYGGNFSDKKYLQGTIPAGVKEFSIKGSIPEPDMFLARTLYERLRSEGIKLRGAFLSTSQVPAPSAFTLLHRTYSPRLKEIVKETNVHSINLYAEALLNMMAVNSGLPGNTKNGIAVVKNWASKKGIRSEEMLLADGSGLSPTNAITTNALTSVLHLNRTNSDFVASLPVSGQSGTLSFLCKGQDCEGKVIAKSGSFTRVLGYTGYVRTQKGQLVSFSFLVNNYHGKSSVIRSKIEKILSEMCKL